MRRLFYFILPVFIIIPYLLCCGSSAASAAEEDGLKCIDVLAYDYPDDYTSVRGIMSPDRPYNIFDMPFSYGLVYYDVIFETSVSVASAGMRSASSGVFYSLTLQSLGSNRYRCYGQTSAAFNSLKFAFQVNTSASANYSVTYYKFDVYTVTDLGTGDLGEMNITPNDDTSVPANYWYRQSSPGVPIVQDFYYFSASKNYVPYEILLSSVNWRKYDYLDFSFSIEAANIESISCYIKTSDGLRRYCPFDICYLNGTAIDANEFIGSGTTTTIPTYNIWNINIRVYIPSSYRLSGSFFIAVNGKYHTPGSKCNLQSVIGYYYTTVPSPDLTKLDQITAAIKESMSSSEADNNAAQDFTNDMTDKKEQMQANQDFINSVDKPSSDDLGEMVSAGAVLDSSGMGHLTAMISPVSNNRIVLSILTISATLALVSYVFFGKKS